MSRPVVLVYEPFHNEGLALLNQFAEVRFPASLGEEDLEAELSEVDGIIIRANGQINRRLIKAAPRLKVIGRHGVGVDNIDLTAAAERAVIVVYTPDAMTESVAEHTLGLMLALSKQIVRTDKAARRGHWHVRYEYIGSELHAKTLGVVGFGRIGQRVAYLCYRAFGMSVLYADVLEYPKAAAEVNARPVSLNDLLEQADVVSLHVPLMPSTRGLIGLENLERMKPNALLINVARGSVVDEAALVTALREGWIAGAGLDVFEEEPASKRNPLFALDNVVVTPHMASHTQQATRRMAVAVVNDVIAVLEGRQPRYPVVVSL